MRECISIDEVMFRTLAAAVYAEDFDAAIETLTLMRASGGEELAALLIRARQQTHALPTLPSISPIVLPAPGADPNILFGGPATCGIYGSAR